MKDDWKQKLEKLDFVTLVGLGRKKRGDDTYASFNRRMLAATVDALLVALFLAPFIDLIFNHFYGPVSLDMPALQEQMRLEPNEQAAGALFWKTMRDSGVIARWLANSGTQMVVMFALTALCWHRWSATPGKLLLRIRIVDAQTFAPINTQQILLRLAGYIVSASALCIGFFWIGIDKHRRAWHDMLAGTAVIVVSKSNSPAADR